MLRVILISIFALNIYAQTLLTDDKEQILKLKKEKALHDRDASKNSWISPLNLSTSIKKSKDSSSTNSSTTKDASLTLNQDIFRSGGIYDQINISKSTYKSTIYSIDLQNSTYLKSLFTSLAEYKKNSLLIKQSRLYIRNHEINLLINKDRYEAGEIDISALNLILIEKEREQLKLIGYESALKNTKLTMEQLSSESVSNMNLPLVPLMSLDEYLENHISLLKTKSDTSTLKYKADLKSSAYLPKVTLNGSYGYKEYDGMTEYDANNYYYGATISMPLDFNKNSNVESAKVEALQSSVESDDLKNEILIAYNKSLNSIDEYEKRILLSKENIKLYQELVDFTAEQFDVGYKTKLDLESLQNSLDIQKTETKIQTLNIEIEKLKLYFDTTLSSSLK